MLTRLGLRSRLVLLVLLAVLPVFGLSAYSAVNARQAVLAQAKVQLQLHAENAALRQQRLVERLAQLLGDMASGPSLIDTRNRACVQHLQNLQSQNPEYLDLGVIGLDGKVSCHAMNTGRQLEAGDQPFFTQIIAGSGFATGGQILGRNAERAGIAFGKPINGADGVLNGVAFASVDVVAVSRALAAGEMLAGAQLRVIDKSGTVLAVRPAGRVLIGSAEQDPVLIDAARVGQPGVRQALDADGQERVYAYAPVSGAARSDLFVTISAPRSLITDGPDARLQVDLLLLALLSAFAMAFVWWMGERLIVSRAQAILIQASEVTHGNLAARVNLSLLGQDEIGQISQAFNRMAESLQTRQSELDEALRRSTPRRPRREAPFMRGAAATSCSRWTANCPASWLMTHCSRP